MSDAQRVAELLKRDPGWAPRQGVISAVHATDGTVTVSFGDGSISGVKCLQQVVPVVGSAVWVMSNGHDRFVIGHLATQQMDSGWLTSGITAASGWTVDSQRYRRVGDIIHVYFTFTRTGSAITVPTNGNISNTAIATLPAGFRPVTYGQPLVTGPAGPLVACYANTSGQVDLAAVAPGTDLSTSGQQLSTGGIILAL